MQQTDVKATHISVSGLMENGRTRIKQFTFVGTAGQSGKFAIFDSLVAPVTSGTYAQSGTTTVTVTKTAHGLNTGDVVGISYNSATGGSATDGNYVVTRTGADTFTVVDPNSNTISGSPPACQYVTGVNRWVTTYETLTGATDTTGVNVPGEGLLVVNGIYAYLLNVTFVTAHFG